MQAVEALCWRTGDVLQAAIVFIGTHVALGLRGLPLLNELFVIVWLVLVSRICREHRARVGQETEPVTRTPVRVTYDACRVTGQGCAADPVVS